MIKKILKKITELYNHWIFRDVKMKEVVLGPEYNKSFVIKYPQNIVIGYKTVLNGNCFINAIIIGTQKIIFRMITKKYCVPLK